MPVIHSKTSNPCPINFGLDEATARVIMDPRASESTIAYATDVVDRIGNVIFDDFVGKLIRDPTAWTLQLVAQTDFGQALAHYSYRQLKISDVTCSHSVKNPKEILLTIEISQNKVSTYGFSRMDFFHKAVKVVQNVFTVLIHLTDPVLSGSRHFFSDNAAFQKLQNYLFLENSCDQLSS